MKIEGLAPEKTKITARIIRKNGTVEDLGEISLENEGLFDKIKNLLRR